VSLAAGREGARSARDRPHGPWWSPATWIRLLVWHWRQAGPVTKEERRGYLFWVPTIVLVLGFEVLAALSRTLRDWIPWPTISSTVGHLEKRWPIVAVLVVGLIAAVAYHALAAREARREDGRTLRDDAPPAEEASWYSPWLVFAIAVVAFVVPYVLGAGKFVLGYWIYGALGLFGIVIPSVLAFAVNRLVGFPTLFFTVGKLRARLHVVALVLVAGLSVLTLHLAFYPWPDIAHESASFAGLNPDAARQKATRELRGIRGTKTPLAYSTQAKGVVEGNDTWFVYFRPGCVVQVTKTTAVVAPECSL